MKIEDRKYRITSQSSIVNPLSSVFSVPSCLCGIQIFLLCRSDAAAQLYGQTQLLQNDLQTSDHGHRVCKIIITQVGNAKDLSLHFALAIGDNSAKVLLEFLNQGFGVDSRGRTEGCEGITRRAFSK